MNKLLVLLSTTSYINKGKVNIIFIYITCNPDYFETLTTKPIIYVSKLSSKSINHTVKLKTSYLLS